MTEITTLQHSFTWLIFSLRVGVIHLQARHTMIADGLLFSFYILLLEASFLLARVLYLSHSVITGEETLDITIKRVTDRLFESLERGDRVIDNASFLFIFLAFWRPVTRPEMKETGLMFLLLVLFTFLYSVFKRVSATLLRRHKNRLIDGYVNFLVFNILIRARVLPVYDSFVAFFKRTWNRLRSRRPIKVTWGKK